MDFIESLKDLSDASAKPAKVCAIAYILEQLPTDEAQALTEALGNSNIHHTRLARLLADRGFPASDRSVMRHRNRESGTGCSCP